MPITIIVKKKPVNAFPDIPDPFGYGQRAVDYIRSLKHPKSTLPGNRFPLDPWQEKIIRQIYGPRRPNGSRIVRNVIALIGRGNRKTTLASGLIMLHAKGPERVQGSEILSAAADRNQAKLVFAELAGMIDPDYAFAPNIGNSAKTIDERRGAKIRDIKNKVLFPGGIAYEAISSDAGSAQGRTPSLAIADEIHVWAKRDPRGMWAALKAGLNKVPNSLFIVTTTAGKGQENLAWDVIEYARKVARGEIDDPATLPILFEAERDCDWRDEKNWHLANPGLRYGYPDIEGLRQYAREAESRPAEREAFKRFHLNIWSDHSSDPFLEMAIYDACRGPVDLDDLEGEPCWLGVDLSSNSDLTAVVAAFRDGEGGYIVYPWFFVPKDNLQKRADHDGVPYPDWAAQEYIEPTPGNVIDTRRVEAVIRELCERFQVREIAFDPHMARDIMANLLEDGYPAVQMRQGWVTMAPAIAELERAIIGGQFRHSGYPVLRWNFDNVACETDKAGNKSFHKGKSKDRIDGAVACAMAVGRAFAGDDERSIYEDTSQRPDGLMVW